MAENYKDLGTAEFFDTPPSKDLEQVRQLAKQAVGLEQIVEGLEKELKAAKAVLLELRRVKLPDAMAEHGLSEFKLEDGSGVKIKNFVAGMLPKSPVERLFALSLLEEHGGADLIKNELTVSFAKKDHNRAIALQQELKAAGYETSVESTVHPSTLAAWCREKVRNGEQLDFDKLGMFVGRDTTIILPENT